MGAHTSGYNSVGLAWSYIGSFTSVLVSVDGIWSSTILSKFPCNTPEQSALMRKINRVQQKSGHYFYGLLIKAWYLWTLNNVYSFALLLDRDSKTKFDIKVSSIRLL